MGKLILCFSMILFFSFHTFFLAPAYWDEGNRMKFLLEIKMKKSYDIDPDLISWMNETKEKNQFLLKDKFKGYRKISKNKEGLKEWNIWEVFTGKNGKSLRKALKKRLHVDDPIKKVLGLENIIAKVRKIEKQICVCMFPAHETCHTKHRGQDVVFPTNQDPTHSFGRMYFHSVKNTCLIL